MHGVRVGVQTHERKISYREIMGVHTERYMSPEKNILASRVARRDTEWLTGYRAPPKEDVRSEPPEDVGYRNPPRDTECKK